MLKRLLVACVGAAALLIAGVAVAGVPCASTSSVDVSVIHVGLTSCDSTEGAFCPAGDQDTVQIDIVIEDCYGNALVGRTATMVVPTGFIVEDPPAPVVTGSLGEGSVKFAQCGGCGFAQYNWVCDGVTIEGNLIHQASFDNDAPPDGEVGLSDFARFSSHFGSANACSDYDCDGEVGLGDFAKFSSHFGHT
jgi:hypothetical protein